VLGHLQPDVELLGHPERPAPLGAGAGRLGPERLDAPGSGFARMARGGGGRWRIGDAQPGGALAREAERLCRLARRRLGGPLLGFLVTDAFGLAAFFGAAAVTTAATVNLVVAWRATASAPV
jgi:hypothetical protein